MTVAPYFILIVTVSQVAITVEYTPDILTRIVLPTTQKFTGRVFPYPTHVPIIEVSVSVFTTSLSAVCVNITPVRDLRTSAVPV